MKQLLLDTNVALWLLFGDREALSAKAIAALSDETSRIRLSAVTVWEIAIKRSLGKLEIETGWYPKLAALDFDPMPVTAEHAHAVEDLPWHHRDPFDRLLIAQAMSDQCDLVTADRQLTAYDVNLVW